ncbi:MAG: hypothetical protein ABSG83_22005 [Roseiarcus sp.]|jgi:hypothetical protein
MIAIASPATPQRDSFLPLVVRPRRWPSLKYPPPASPDHHRNQKYHPVAGGEHLLAMLYPSKSSLIVISTTRQKTPAPLKSP